MPRRGSLSRTKPLTQPRVRAGAGGALRRCRLCGVEQPLDTAHFYPRDHGRYFHSVCRPCFSAQQRRTVSARRARSQENDDQDRAAAVTVPALSSFKDVESTTDGAAVTMVEMGLFAVPYVARGGGPIQQLVLEAVDAQTATARAREQLGAESELALGRPHRIAPDCGSRRASLRWLPPPDAARGAA